MRSRLFPVLILLVALCLAAGCRGASSTAAAGPAPIRIGHFPNLTHAPALLARSRGEFEKAFAPRKVEWHLFNAGPSAIEALFAGQLDLLYVGPGPAVNGFVKSAGREVRVVAGVTAGGAGLVVREGSGIADASQLAGRRVASPQAGNTQDIALRNFLLARGLGWTGRGGTVDIAPIPGAEQLTLFQKGELDAAWAVEPWLSRLVVEGPGRLLVDEATLWPDGRYLTTVLVARPDFLAKDPAAAAAAIEVNRKAVEQLASGDAGARGEVERLLLRLTGKSLGRKILDPAWGRLTFSTDSMPAALARIAEDSGRLGFLPAGSKIDGIVATVTTGSAPR